jgi:hypothetical protein
MMEIIAASDFDSGWGVKTAPPLPFATSMVPSTVPSTVPSVPSFKAMSGIEAPNTRAGLQSNGQAWAGAADHLE